MRVQLGLQRPVALRGLGLRLEVLDLACELAPDVVDPQQVLARVVEPELGLLRRSRYFDTPAASSRKTRSSSGFASTMREIIPCSMIA